MNVDTLVSVVIPTFNRSDFILKAVDSVIRQTGIKFEIIVVDDGSNDDTEDKLSDYIEKGVLFFIKQQNRGPAAARNLGIKRAKGNYICFLDADDTFEVNSIKDRVSVYEKYPQIGLLCSDFRETFLGKDNAIIQSTEFSRRKIIKNEFSEFVKIKDGDIHLFNKEIYYDPLLLRRMIWTGTVVVPKNVFANVGFFNEELRIAEDIDLWLRIAKKYEIVFLSSSTATYFVHDGGITKNIPNYYNSTNTVLVKYLEQNPTLPLYCRKKITEKIASYFFIIGYYYYEKNKYKEAGFYFRKSIKYNCLFLNCYQYAALTLLPYSVISGLRNFRRYLLGLRKTV
ncbi:MAG: glycosyltransferase [Desulfuromonadaceae bacterium]|nr:glycosyltransferase [Desulfuromonadaceae bacterium]